MARIKIFVLYPIAFIFAIFLTLKYYSSLILLYAFAKAPLKICQSLKKINTDICVKTNENQGNSNKYLNQKSKQNTQKLEHCFQSIIDSCISLCLTATFVNYNKLLVKGTLIICHNVHHSFLKLIYEGLPDYTKEIQDSYSSFLTWGFIVCGFFGITTQLAFIMDLINILTLPTKLIYTLLRWLYSKSLILIGKLYQFIRTDDEKWLTCPYLPKYLTPNYRTAALMLLIVLAQLTVFTVFYYLWLCLVIVGLVFIDNVIHNLESCLSLLGYGFCLVKKYGVNKKDKEIRSTFCPLLEPETAVKILKGTNVFERANDRQNQEHENSNGFSLISVFTLFSALAKDQLKE